MTYADDDDEENVVDDPIKDAVVTYPDAMEAILACQLDGILGARTCHELPQTGGDSFLNWPVELSDLSGRSR